MNTITVKNLSTLMDYAALARVVYFMSGDDYSATHSNAGEKIVRIIHKGNVYTVLDNDARP